MRDARPDDRSTIESIAERSYSMYVERIGRRPAPMDEDYGDRIERGQVRVATTDDDRVVGVIVQFPKDDHFYVHIVAVQPEAQGSGIGVMLMNDADRAAVAAGFDRVRLYTNEKMTENLAFYPRRGYGEIYRTTEDGFNRVYFERAVSPEGNAAVPTVQLDDGVFRVTEWRFAPGAATGFHRHGHDYVVVPMTTGDLEIVSATGTARAPLVAGQAYARSAGVEHDVRNPNPYEFVFVEVERLV